MLPHPAPPSPAPTTAPSPGPARSLAPDLARGVMLLLIAIANSSWYLWGHPGGLTSAHPTDGSQLDRSIRAIMAIAIDGRVYPMFALLFGYGMVQFARSRTDRGIRPPEIKRMLRRRHLAMLLIGFVHAALLFAGDILGAYAVLGLILVPLFFESSVRTLKIVIGVLLGWALLTSLGSIASLAWVDSMGIDATGQSTPVPEGFEFPGLATLLSGVDNYLIAIAIRIGCWLIATPAVLLTGLMPAALVLGWLLARYRVLDDPARYRPQLRALAIGGIAFGWLTGIPTAFAHLGRPLLSPNLEMGYANFHYAGGFAAGVGYAALFGLIASRSRPRPNPVARAVAAVGKRSLTCYLLQSVIFAPLLAAWGLGLGVRLNTAAVVAIAAGIWVVSIILAVILEARGARGPAEVLLRKMTYLPDRLAPAAHAAVSGPAPGPASGHHPASAPGSLPGSAPGPLPGSAPGPHPGPAPEPAPTPTPGVTPAPGPPPPPAPDRQRSSPPRQGPSGS